MFHYSLSSFFRAHWNISMLSEALSERLLRNKNWPSPKCTVLSTRQKKNTLIFPHKVGWAHTGGNGCIEYEQVKNSPKHHCCTWEQTQNSLHLPSTSLSAPCLVQSLAARAAPRCAPAAGEDPQVLASPACRHLLHCQTSCSAAELCILQTCWEVFHKCLPLSWKDKGKVPMWKLKINKLLKQLLQLSDTWFFEMRKRSYSETCTEKGQWGGVDGGLQKDICLCFQFWPSWFV